MYLDTAVVFMLHVMCRYQVPKHIKIHESATGHYYLTKHTEFNSIPVTVTVTRVLPLLLNLMCFYIILSSFTVSVQSVW